jgi:hypothetical protein
MLEPVALIKVVPTKQRAIRIEGLHLLESLFHGYLWVFVERHGVLALGLWDRRRAGNLVFSGEEGHVVQDGLFSLQIAWHLGVRVQVRSRSSVAQVVSSKRVETVTQWDGMGWDNGRSGGVRVLGWLRRTRDTFCPKRSARLGLAAYRSL